MTEWNAESFEQAAKAEEAKQAPQEQQAPEPKAEEQPQELVEERVKKVVPLGALDKEKARRREAVAALQAKDAEIAQIRQEMAAMRQAQQAATAPKPPDPSVDPAGAILFQQRQIQDRLQAQEQENEQLKAQQGQQAQFQQFVSRVQTLDAEFAEEQPDSREAINFLKQSRVKEYEAGGLTRQEATQRMLKDELDLTVWAMQRGENPAAVAYRMASERGYVNSKQKLEMRKEGQGASGPSSGGGKSGGLPSYETMLKADRKTFAEMTKGDNWRKLMDR